eukprot:ANDGO_08510.mRNA.1 hypothetical protein
MEEESRLQILELKSRNDELEREVSRAAVDMHKAKTDFHVLRVEYDAMTLDLDGARAQLLTARRTISDLKMHLAQTRDEINAKDELIKTTLETLDSIEQREELLASDLDFLSKSLETKNEENSFLRQQIVRLLDRLDGLEDSSVKVLREEIMSLIAAQESKPPQPTFFSPEKGSASPWNEIIKIREVLSERKAKLESSLAEILFDQKSSPAKQDLRVDSVLSQRLDAWESLGKKIMLAQNHTRHNYVSRPEYDAMINDLARDVRLIESEKIAADSFRLSKLVDEDFRIHEIVEGQNLSFASTQSDAGEMSEKVSQTLEVDVDHFGVQTRPPANERSVGSPLLSRSVSTSTLSDHPVIPLSCNKMQQTESDEKSVEHRGVLVRSLMSDVEASTDVSSDFLDTQIEKLRALEAFRNAVVEIKESGHSQAVQAYVETVSTGANATLSLVSTGSAAVVPVLSAGVSTDIGMDEFEDTVKTCILLKEANRDLVSQLEVLSLLPNRKNQGCDPIIFCRSVASNCSVDVCAKSCMTDLSDFDVSTLMRDRSALQAERAELLANLEEVICNQTELQRQIQVHRQLLLSQAASDVSVQVSFDSIADSDFVSVSVQASPDVHHALAQTVNQCDSVATATDLRQPDMDELFCELESLKNQISQKRTVSSISTQIEKHDEHLSTVLKNAGTSSLNVPVCDAAVDNRVAIRVASVQASVEMSTKSLDSFKSTPFSTSKKTDTDQLASFATRGVNTESVDSVWKTAHSSKPVVNNRKNLSFCHLGAVYIHPERNACDAESQCEASTSPVIGVDEGIGNVPVVDGIPVFSRGDSNLLVVPVCFSSTTSNSGPATSPKTNPTTGAKAILPSLPEDASAGSVRISRTAKFVASSDNARLSSSGEGDPRKREVETSTSICISDEDLISHIMVLFHVSTKVCLIPRLNDVYLKLTRFDARFDQLLEILGFSQSSTDRLTSSTRFSHVLKRIEDMKKSVDDSKNQVVVLTKASKVLQQVMDRLRVDATSEILPTIDQLLLCR